MMRCSRDDIHSEMLLNRMQHSFMGMDITGYSGIDFFFRKASVMIMNIRLPIFDVTTTGLSDINKP